MKILFDECVPRRLRTHLSPHQVTTIQQKRWNGIKNGELLALASREFEVLLTVDRGLRFQQNPHTLPIAVVGMEAPSNRYKDLLPLMPQVLGALHRIKTGEMVWVKK